MLDEILCLEVSNLARQLKFNPEIGDDHPVITHITTSLWFRSIELTITSSTSRARGPSNERKNVAAAEKQLKSIGYRLTQEKREVAVSDRETRECDGQDERECSTRH